MRQRREISSATLASIEALPKEKQAAALDGSTGSNEEEWFETQQQQHEIDRLKLSLLNQRNDIAARKGLGIAIFALVCGYLAAVLTIIVFAGRGKIHLSDAILLGLLGSGSANVIGIFHYVTKYLFKADEGDSPRIASKPPDQSKIARPDRKAIAPKPDPPNTGPEETDKSA